MNDIPEDIKLKSYLTALVQEAHMKGYVVTIEQVPLKPLAMGNYRTVVNVRERRKDLNEH